MLSRTYKKITEAELEVQYPPNKRYKKHNKERKGMKFKKCFSMKFPELKDVRLYLRGPIEWPIQWINTYYITLWTFGTLGQRRFSKSSRRKKKKMTKRTRLQMFYPSPQKHHIQSRRTMPLTFWENILSNLNLHNERINKVKKNKDSFRHVSYWTIYLQCIS